MFHLLVKASGWKSSSNGDLWEGRALTVNEFTSEELVHQFRPQGKFDMARIAQYPAVFMQEAEAGADEIARIGRVTGVVR